MECHPGPDAAQDHLNVSLMVWFTPAETGRQPSRKFKTCLISPQNISPKEPVDHQDVSRQM